MQVSADLSRFLIDLRHSARHFARTPGVSLALLLTIALGIGSNVSVHGFVQGLTRSRLPPAARDRVVSIFRRDVHREDGPLSYQDYVSLRNHPGPFEWIGAARVSPQTVTISGQSEILSVAAVTPDLASSLDLSFKEGVVISHRVWESEFRAKADVGTEQIRVDGVDLRVSGVAPEWLEGVYGDRAVDLWMPLEEQPAQAFDRVSQNLWVLAKRRATIQDQAGFRVLPYTGMTPEAAQGRSRVGTLLTFAGVLVFFIACANVACFLVGRASARSHETSLRVALGAGRGQLIRGLLSDSIVISLAGGAFGLLLALWTSLVLPALLFDEDARHLVFAPDVFSIVAACAACVAITVVCGLLPVFTISHHDPATVLRRESAGPSIGIQRLRVGLVVAQMTGCCVLVISTAFLVTGFRGALKTGLSHRLRHPILASVLGTSFAGQKYFQDVQQAAQSVKGVSGRAWAGRLPGEQAEWATFRIDTEQLPLRDVTLDVAAFTSDSFALFTLPPVAGRLFRAEDRSCRAAVVNEAAAKVLFGQGTVGRSIHDAGHLPVEIVGVLAMRQGGAGSHPAIYYYQADQKGPRSERIGPAQFRAPVASKLQQVELDSNVVSPGYFEVMGWPLVAGSNDPTHVCRVAVVNQEAADLYFAGKAVGASVIDDAGRRTEIIGVVHSLPLGTFERRVEPAIYFPMAQDFHPYMTLILSAQELNKNTLEELRAKIEPVPGRGPAPVMVKTLDTYLSQTALAPLRIATMIIGASAAIALALSVIGLFGALSDAVRQRRREFAVRFALGAQRRHVIWEVLKDGGRLAFAGTLAGTLGSLLLSRKLAGIIPGNPSPAIWVWMAAPLLLAASVVLASVLPARRASAVNPLTIMRDE